MESIITRLSEAKGHVVYEPSWPFGHHYYLIKGTLAKFPNTHGAFKAAFKEPAIIFCGKNSDVSMRCDTCIQTDHPSLRFGESVNFIRLLGDNPLNTVILTEPEFTNEEVRRLHYVWRRVMIEHRRSGSLVTLKCGSP